MKNIRAYRMGAAVEIELMCIVSYQINFPKCLDATAKMLKASPNGDDGHRKWQHGGLVLS